ncbi:MAG: transposase [Rhodobacteraceae bacterium]|nr:transposase [Paracoccaceae bacterium]
MKSNSYGGRNGCLYRIDVAKEVHWACAMDRNARVLFSQAVGNDPAAIVSLIGKIEALEAENTRTAIDMLGGAASLLCAMFAEAGLPLVHTPGLAVNRARQGIRAASASPIRRTRSSLPSWPAPGPTCAQWSRQTRSMPRSGSWSAAAASSSPSRPGVRRACATCSPASFRRWSGASTPPPAPALCFSAIMPRPRISAPQGQSASPAG